MNELATKEHKGSCLCGAVQFTASGDPVVVAQCHCTECQKTSGTGHTTGAMFSMCAVEITGEVSKYSYVAANGNEVTKAFCVICSSSIYGSNSGNTEYLTFAVGCMEDIAAFTPEVVIFTENQPHWDLIDPNLPAFAKQPNWKPENEA